MAEPQPEVVYTGTAVPTVEQILTGFGRIKSPKKLLSDFSLCLRY